MRTYRVAEHVADSACGVGGDHAIMSSSAGEQRALIDWGDVLAVALSMKDLDYLCLDGHSLKTFLVVLEEQSMSRAALRLEVTQSAVSHTINRLRDVLGDPLFVRSGRGIRPTERAGTLAEPIRRLLDDMKKLTAERIFDPQVDVRQFTIAANDFQRALLFPELLRSQRDEGIDLRLRFIASGIPDALLLREGRCDLLVTPFPPEGPDIFNVRLFSDRMVCYFDEAMRSPPTTLEAFTTAPHVEARFADNRTSLQALSYLPASQLPSPHISVPNFASLKAFIQGTLFVTAALSLMGEGPLKGLSQAPLPFESEKMVMYLVWHRRDHADPANRWLRERIREVARRVTSIR